MSALVQLSVSIQLLQRHDRLRLADRIVNREIGAQTIAVLHQDVPAETQFGLFALGLAIQNTFRIGRALMGLVAPLFAVKIHRRIARVLIFGCFHLLLIGSVLAHKAL